MKCLTLQTDEMEYIQKNLIVWYCQSCITEVFPYNHIELDEVFVSEVNSIETIFIEIEKDIFDKKNNIIIAVIYRPPGSDIKVFNEIFYELLNKIKTENNLVYLMGDYNVNLLNYGKHNETNEFVDMLHASSFISLINRPTRVQKESATLIDNIFTNNHSRLDQTFQGLIYTDITDHFPIIHIDYDKTDNSTEMYLTRRNLSQRNRHRFCIEIPTLHLSSVYNEIDTQNAFSQFHTVLINISTSICQKRKLDYNTTLVNYDWHKDLKMQ